MSFKRKFLITYFKLWKYIICIKKDWHALKYHVIDFSPILAHWPRIRASKMYFVRLGSSTSSESKFSSCIFVHLTNWHTRFELSKHSLGLLICYKCYVFLASYILDHNLRLIVNLSGLFTEALDVVLLNMHFANLSFYVSFIMSTFVFKYRIGCAFS